MPRLRTKAAAGGSNANGSDDAGSGAGAGAGAAMDGIMFDAFSFSEATREGTNDCPLLAAGRHAFRAHGE
jgi:hypothetical protein